MSSPFALILRGLAGLAFGPCFTIVDGIVRGRSASSIALSVAVGSIVDAGIELDLEFPSESEDVSPFVEMVAEGLVETDVGRLLRHGASGLPRGIPPLSTAVVDCYGRSPHFVGFVTANVPRLRQGQDVMILEPIVLPQGVRMPRLLSGRVLGRTLHGRKL